MVGIGTEVKNRGRKVKKSGGEREKERERVNECFTLPSGG